jgi:hypothetical protein
MRNARFRPYWIQAEEKEWQRLWGKGVFKKWSRKDLQSNDRVFTSRYVYKLVGWGLCDLVCLVLVCRGRYCLGCVFITAVPITTLFAWGGGGDNGGHVLRGTTSRGLCGLVCPSHTSERGGEGYCVKGGGGEEGERERERAKEVRLHYSLGYSG